MGRGIVLALSTACLLVLLFLTYTFLVQDPSHLERETAAEEEDLPRRTEVSAKETLHIQGVPLPPGEGADYTIYDDKTGRPKQRVRFADWRKVADSENEILVTAPRMMIILPGGQVATISADEGQMAVDTIRRSDMRPRSGSLRGNARIVIDRATGRDRTPIAERPEDLITITMGTLDFDLVNGLLRTDGAVDVVLADAELSGLGLELVWNDSDDRLEKLLLKRGGKIVLHRGGDLLGGFMGGETAEAGGAAGTAESSPRVGRSAKPVTTYLCRMEGNVVAQQLRGKMVVGGLDAEFVEMMFDVGGGARLGDSRQPTTAPSTQPATQPTTQPVEPEPPGSLVVVWTGRLTISPLAPSGSSTERRRWFVAGGDAVRLHRRANSVLCGRLEYRDEAEQIWLQPCPDGRVHFAVGNDVSASAGNAYVDTAANVIKLISDVRLEDRRRGPGAPALSMRCAHSAELLLADSEDDAANRESAAAADVVNLTALREATFVGAVAIRMAEQRLTAERVTIYFREGPSDAPIESLFDRATARGNVVLITRPTGGWGRLSWVPQAGALLRDATYHSFGFRGMGQLGARQSLACDWLEAKFERDEAGEVYPKVVDATGAIELRDRRSNVAARGRKLTAEFGAGGRLLHATVFGQGSRPAWVYAEPFAVVGQQIDLDPRTQSLDVPGSSRLSFVSSLSLQGRSHGKERVTHVTSEQSMHVSGPENVARFRGLVVATSGDERLRCDELELWLADAEPISATASARPSWGAVLKQMRGGASAESEPEPRRLFTTDVDRGGFARKDAVQLVAKNAVIESETYAPGDPRPLMQSSIKAPTLNVDIPKRIIETLGGTTLLMTSRQLKDRTTPETASFGVPSGMMTRGPHQTVIKCDGKMTYAIGSEGPERRDGVVFDQNVFFVHAAGRAMAEIDTILTEAEQRSAEFVNLTSRRSQLRTDRLECTFAVSDAVRKLRQQRQTAGPPMQLSQLLATGNVYMGDRQGNGIREVNADQVDYNQASGLVIVRGRPAVPARVYYSNPQTGQLAAPAVGTEIVVDLHNNTVRVPGKIHGEFIIPSKPDRP